MEEEPSGQDAPLAMIVPVIDEDEGQFRANLVDLEVEVTHLSTTVKRLSYLTWMQVVMLMPVLGWTLYEMMLGNYRST